MSALSFTSWLAMGVAAALSAIALVILRYARGRLPHAEPVDRSLHRRPVMRVGGLAIWAGFLPVALSLQLQPAMKRAVARRLGSSHRRIDRPMTGAACGPVYASSCMRLQRSPCRYRSSSGTLLVNFRRSTES
jgi:predicted metal-binding membrane protein